MPDWILFLPILWLPVGALGFGLAAPKVSSRARPWLPIIYLALEIVAVLANIASAPHQVSFSNWQLASFSIVFQMGGVEILILLSIFVPLLALWHVAAPRLPDVVRQLWLPV